MTNYAGISHLAEEFYKAFEWKTRTNGEKYVALKENSPEWMTSAVHAAHADMLPDDWRYKMIRHVLDYMGEQGEDLDEDSKYQICDDMVDVYTMHLVDWLTSHGRRVGYVDDANDEYGPSGNLEAMLQRGQYMEIEEIYDALFSFLEEMVDEEEENNNEQ